MMQLRIQTQDASKLWKSTLPLKHLQPGLSSPPSIEWLLIELLLLWWLLIELLLLWWLLIVLL